MDYKLIDDVVDLVNAEFARSSTQIGDQINPTPPPEAVRELLRVCFVASLKREEGRITEFDLALYSRQSDSKIPYRYSRYTKIFTLMEFEVPRELTPGELVRLAPACDSKKTLILAQWAADGAGSCLWGLADVGGPDDGSFGPLREFRIRGHAPGDLSVSVRGRTICRYRDGKIQVPEAGLINRGAIYEFFRATSLDFAEHILASTNHVEKPCPLAERDERAFGYLAIIQDLADGMQQLGHGGCILIIPESNFEGVWDNLTSKYKCENESIWTQLVGRWIYYYHRNAMRFKSTADELFSAESQLHEMETGLRNSVAGVTALTGVDGAVLMTRKFQLLGFGCVVPLREQTKYRVFRSADRRGEHLERIVPNEYGTRHRSAFEFCYRFSPSVAIVVSSDSGIKFVTRRNDDVYFWENTSFDSRSERDPYDMGPSDFGSEQPP